MAESRCPYGQANEGEAGAKTELAKPFEEAENEDARTSKDVSCQSRGLRMLFAYHAKEVRVN